MKHNINLLIILFQHQCQMTMFSSMCPKQLISSIYLNSSAIIKLDISQIGERVDDIFANILTIYEVQFLLALLKLPFEVFQGRAVILYASPWTRVMVTFQAIGQSESNSQLATAIVVALHHHSTEEDQRHDQEQ